MGELNIFVSKNCGLISLLNRNKCITCIDIFCRMSLGSTLSEEVDSMSDKLNYLKMEEVVQHLRLVYTLKAKTELINLQDKF